MPGLVSLLITPWIIYKLAPPELRKTPNAPAIAAKRLKVRRRRWNSQACPCDTAKFHGQRIGDSRDKCVKSAHIPFVCDADVVRIWDR